MAANNTGLPDPLRAGIERLSGASLGSHIGLSSDERSLAVERDLLARRTPG